LNGLPSLPQTYLELTETLARPDASIRDVAAVIERDMAMAAKVLQLVNSAFFGLSRRVVNIAEAVNYLGVGTMKALVLANAVFRDAGRGETASMVRQQTHALLSAKCAKSVLRGSRKADVAFTAALLHDVGALVLESRLPSECEANRQFAKERQVPLFRAEKERLGVTHAEVGACLLGLWGLPYDVIEAVVRHHAPFSDFIAVDVDFAVRVATALVPDSDQDCDDTAGEDVAHAADRLGIGPLVEALRAELAQHSTGPGSRAS
jgi:HD-like signal output (HDOD) protein